MRALLPASLALLVAAACGGAAVPAPRVVVGVPDDPAVAPLLAALNCTDRRVPPRPTSASALHPGHIRYVMAIGMADFAIYDS